MANGVTTAAGTYDAWFSGATASNFQHPYTLTASLSGLPLLTESLASGVPGELRFQLWGSIEGVIPATR
jgi:hypothetical protein